LIFHLVESVFLEQKGAEELAGTPVLAPERRHWIASSGLRGGGGGDRRSLEGGAHRAQWIPDKVVLRAHHLLPLSSSLALGFWTWKWGAIAGRWAGEGRRGEGWGVKWLGVSRHWWRRFPPFLTPLPAIAVGLGTSLGPKWAHFFFLRRKKMGRNTSYGPKRAQFSAYLKKGIGPRFLQSIVVEHWGKQTQRRDLYTFWRLNLKINFHRTRC